MNDISIDGRKVGKNHPAYIIAEVGINHNGDLGIAQQLIDVAKESGVDAVKFQSWTAESLVSKNNPDYGRLKDLQLSKDMHYEVVDYCAAQGITFLSSAFDKKGLDFLEELGVPAHKIASCELTNLHFIDYVAQKGKPILISGGFGKHEEIGEALCQIRAQKNEDIILLHCIGAYPPKVEDTNLKFMQKLEEDYGVLVGLSDHSMTLEIPYAAVAMGGVCIEKHITLDRTMEGFDHEASIESDQLEKLVSGIRLIEKAMGNGVREIGAEEGKLLKIMRKSVLASTYIKQGDTITRDSLQYRRPGAGLLAKEIPSLIGMTAKKDIEEGDYLRYEDLE
jgi:N,N'-diacetyllegionaminate synthase